MKLHDPWMMNAKSPTQRALMLVHGMRSARCASSVASALGLIRGVSKVEISLQQSEVEIVFDPSKAEPQQFQTAVRAVGFRPEFIEETQAAA